jgi:hypothetical protein
MLNTPFVIVFEPVAGACGTRLKENVPETAVAVKVLIVTVPIPPITFAVQSCAPISSNPFVPLTVEELIRYAPGVAGAAIAIVWAFVALVALSDAPKDTLAFAFLETAMHAATHETPLICALIEPVEVLPEQDGATPGLGVGVGVGVGVGIGLVALEDGLPLPHATANTSARRPTEDTILITSLLLANQPFANCQSYGDRSRSPVACETIGVPVLDVLTEL